MKNNYKQSWLYLLLFMFVFQAALAQTKAITGTVTGVNDNQPLPGASVIVQGTNRGTQTDFDGNFTISASPNESLVISYVGFITITKNVGQSSEISVALKPDSNALDEVIVTAYGTSTKEAFTGSASVIRSEDLEQRVVTSPHCSDRRFNHWSSIFIRFGPARLFSKCYYKRCGNIEW